MASLNIMIVVGLYILVSAPLLGIALYVHSLKSDYTGLFMTAVLLQIIPIGLIFFPLGLFGLVLLGVSLYLVAGRYHRFQAAGIDNAAVARRWLLTYRANLVAFGLALDQKAIAWLFVEVAAKKGFFPLYWIAPASGVLWLIVAILLKGTFGRAPKPMEATHEP